ncbi:hypothetical protein KY314_03270 [Candidatus Woesearchaeota archaeon]|nr:hypothetical protein [Candidatus Woesearchaeota archaeon]
MKKKKGWLAVKNNKVKIKEAKIPHIEGLKQYNNYLELKACLWGMKSTKAKEVQIIVDSTVTMSWFNQPHNNLGKFSQHHYQLKEEIEKEKLRFKNIKVVWKPRDKNLAGIALEKKFKV